MTCCFVLLQKEGHIDLQDAWESRVRFDCPFLLERLPLHYDTANPQAFVYFLQEVSCLLTGLRADVHDR